MKLIPVIAAVAFVAVPAVAQDAMGTDAAAGETAAATRLSLDTPIETIAADTKGKAVLEANLPGITTNASYDMYKSFSLRQIAAYAPERLPAEALAKTEADLAKID